MLERPAGRYNVEQFGEITSPICKFTVNGVCPSRPMLRLPEWESQGTAPAAVEWVAMRRAHGAGVHADPRLYPIGA